MTSPTTRRRVANAPRPACLSIDVPPRTLSRHAPFSRSHGRVRLASPGTERRAVPVPPRAYEAASLAFGGRAARIRSLHGTVPIMRSHRSSTAAVPSSSSFGGGGGNASARSTNPSRRRSAARKSSLRGIGPNVFSLSSNQLSPSMGVEMGRPCRGGGTRGVRVGSNATWNDNDQRGEQKDKALRGGRGDDFPLLHASGRERPPTRLSLRRRPPPDVVQACAVLAQPR